MVQSKIIWGLVWINVALLLGLTLKMTSPTASAQAHRPSDYLMIPGEVVGGSFAVIYIVDTNQGRLSAVSFDDTSGRIGAMPPLDLNQIFQAAGGGAPREVPRY
jgi:hypothetical protein